MQTGMLHEHISQGKQIILFWKVRENEFCRVLGTMAVSYDTLTCTHLDFISSSMSLYTQRSFDLAPKIFLSYFILLLLL